MEYGLNEDKPPQKGTEKTDLEMSLLSLSVHLLLLLFVFFFLFF